MVHFIQSYPHVVNHILIEVTLLERKGRYATRGNNSNRQNTFSELLLEVCVADGLGCLTHLSEDFLESSHAADDAPCHTQVDKHY